MHLHFYHPSNRKFYAVMKRGFQKRTNETMCSILERRSASPDACAPSSVVSFHFRASLPPHDISSNPEAVIDLVWLKSHPVLHAVCIHTLFQGAALLKSKSAEDIWAAFLECWVSLYIGFPDSRGMTENHPYPPTSSEIFPRQTVYP